MSRFEVIAFDADDTLWHNERHYTAAQAKLKALLAHYHRPEWVEERLFQMEMRNLKHFGYGIKSFALSMIETAVELTEGRISGHEIQTLIEAAKEMLAADVELLPYAGEALAALAPTHALMLITKGELRDQEQKIARSGVAHYFRHVEIVSDKRPENYAALLKRYDIAPDRFLMVGNSLRSDILPVLELGASAVYVPYERTWAYEAADAPRVGHPGYYAVENLGLVPNLIAELERQDT